MPAIDVTGTVFKCDVRRSVDVFNTGRRYSPNNEYYVIRHNVGLRTADGKRYFFDGPAVKMTVANAPGVSVVLYHVDGEAGNWFRKIDGSGVATAERANTNGVESLLKEGDTITVRGSLKTEKPAYSVLNRVKRR